jgi:hypothetical protein
MVVNIKVLGEIKLILKLRRLILLCLPDIGIELVILGELLHALVEPALVILRINSSTLEL